MDLQPNPAVNQPVDGMPSHHPWQETSKELALVATFFGDLLFRAATWLEKEIRQASENHLRGERLAAYRARHQWKRSDIQPLLSIGVNASAQRRMATLQGRGRPVVKMHRPIGEVLFERVALGLNMLRDNATLEERHRYFRKWPWWKHHVEAYYRGELTLARDMGIKAPYDHAERVVGRRLGMSQGSVHAVCGEIRKMRQEDPEYANFPERTLTHYNQLLSNGWKTDQVEDT